MSSLDLRISPVKAGTVPLTDVVMTNQCHLHWSLVLHHCHEECNFSLFQQVDKIYSPLTSLKLVMLLQLITEGFPTDVKKIDAN